jgi:transposase-like protein
MSRGYPVEQWVKWIEQQKASGLSVAAFCDRIGVSQNAFYWRRRRLAQHSKASPFVALRLSSAAPVEVELPCGATVRVSDPGYVRAIVAALLDHGTQQ